MVRMIDTPDSMKGIEVIIDIKEQRNRTFRKPETKEDREKREREEKKAIDVKAMCLTVTSLKPSQAVALYDAGYRIPKGWRVI